jgi:predicted AlkP superfamily phosphohydrolase/phosphomutase
MTVVVAIAEGIEKSMLRVLVEQGSLPWFASALKTGAFFDLGSGAVPYEPPNLTSALTGVSPGEHGCYSYWSVDNRNSLPRVLNARDVKVPRLWNWPELAHKKFGIVNVQLTFPPEPMQGFTIAYLMQQTLHYTYPPDLTRRLNSERVRYAHDVSAFYRGQAADQFAGEILRIANYQLNAALHLASSVDVLIINLTIADRLSHFLWREVEQTATSDRSHLVLGYQFLDAALYKLNALRGQNDPMLIFSEMGFGKLDYFFSIDRELQKLGLQRLDENGDVDTRLSVAREAVQGTHGINLLESSGPDVHDTPKRIDEICAALKELVFPDDGSPVLASARPKEEVYHGSYVHLAPDIIVEPANPERPPMGDPRWAEHVNRQLQTGWHRHGGFGLLLGRSPCASLENKIEPESLAPTIARLLNADIPNFCLWPSLVA